MKAEYPLPDDLRKAISTLAGNRSVWLVGGAVRNHFLQQVTNDFDLTVSGSAEELARKVADELGGSFFMLDADRDTARVLRKVDDGRLQTVDFCGLRGNTIEEDLISRDYSINAMAFPLGTTEVLLDPCNGLQDLHDKRLRMCHPGSIQEDPVRALRAIRLALAFDLAIEPDTLRSIKTNAESVSTVSMERIRDEFFLLFASSKVGQAIRLTDRLQLLKPIFPEVESLKGLQLPPPHSFDAFDHTLAVIDGLGSLTRLLGVEFHRSDAGDLVLAEVSLHLGRYRNGLNEYLLTQISSGRNLIQLLFLAALHHDVGKAPRFQEEFGDLPHSDIGELVMKRRARKIRLSNAEMKWLERVVRFHSIPASLETKPQVSDLEGYRFFRNSSSSGIAILLLSLADLLGRYSPQPPVEKLSARVEVIRSLLEIRFNRSEILFPPRLLDGHDLLRRVEIPPGPIYSMILEKIREAQIMGTVNNQEDALVLARKILSEGGVEQE